MTTVEGATELPFACDVEGCDSRFAKSQALGAHKARSHGIPGQQRERNRLAAEQRSKATTRSLPVWNGKGEPPSASPFMAGVESQLHELSQPLRDQLASIESRREQVSAELSELRAAETRIRGVLAKLDPASVEAKANGSSRQSEGDSKGNAARAERQLAEKVEGVAKWLEAHADEFPDGLTANLLAAAATKDVPRGLSTKSARQVLDVLHERGVVRADRVTRGGGMNFKLMKGSQT